LYRFLARRAEQLPSFDVHGMGESLNRPQLKPWPPSGLDLLEVLVLKAGYLGKLLLSPSAQQP